MSLPSVSIIMSVTDRLSNLRRTLMAWSLLTYPETYEFIIIDNGTNNPEVEKIVTGSKLKGNIQFKKEEKVTAVNILYNKYGKESKGEYIVFAMMDEIISHGDILQKMVDITDEKRVTLAVSWLDGDQTAALDVYKEWHTNPSTLPTKWGGVIPQAAIMGHITGNYRKNWEWFGWYRDLPQGHLWLEQDIHIREVCLNRVAVTPTDVWCYHQFHATKVPYDAVRPGFHYRTEREARLIDQAERDKA